MSRPKTRHGWCFVVALMATYVAAFAQRQAPATVAGPLSYRYLLSDGELGGLIGYGFALPYAFCAFASGWFVDNMPRVRLLGAGLAVASIATVATGVAASLHGLIALRLLVGVGQSILVPAAYSLLGDVIPRANTGRAVAALAAAPFLGAGMMLVLGSGAASSENWLVLFTLAGSVGLVVSGGWLMVREPARIRPAGPASDSVPGYLKLYWKPALATDLAIAFGVMAAHALLAWGVVWLVRAHGLSASGAALGLGCAVLIGGAAGAMIAGFGSDALLRRQSRPCRLCLFSATMVCGAGVALCAFAATSATVALGALPLLVALVAAGLTLGPAALQDMTPAGLRGRQHGFAVLIANLLGLGLGPLLIGIATDAAGDAAAIGRVMAFALPAMLGVSASLGVLARALEPRASPAVRSMHPAGRPRRHNWQG